MKSFNRNMIDKSRNFLRMEEVKSGGKQKKKGQQMNKRRESLGRKENEAK